MFIGRKSLKSIVIIITIMIISMIVSVSYLFACKTKLKKYHSDRKQLFNRNIQKWNNINETVNTQKLVTSTIELLFTPEATPSIVKTQDVEPLINGLDNQDQQNNYNDLKNTIYKLTSIFENSTTELKYTYCENIGDGRGLTFGFPGFCSGTYDGTVFLKEYQKLNPDNILVKYIERFVKIDMASHPGGLNSDTSGLENFAADLDKCGNDKYMIKAQHNVVDSLYWNPSQAVANEIGAKYSITKGELYDSFINHGEDGAREIISVVNSKLGGTPKTGINEVKWLSTFLEVRLSLLQADSTWSEAVDRVHVYEKIIKESNLNLDKPIYVTCYGDSFVID